MEEISLKGKRVLIIGGTNKVLQLACKRFIKKGCEKVTILCLHKDESLNMDEFPNVEIMYGDIHYLNSKQLSIAMMFHNYLVIASSKTTKRGVVNEDINEYAIGKKPTKEILKILKTCYVLLKFAKSKKF